MAPLFIQLSLHVRAWIMGGDGCLQTDSRFGRRRSAAEFHSSTLFLVGSDVPMILLLDTLRMADLALQGHAPRRDDYFEVQKVAASRRSRGSFVARLCVITT